MERESFENEAVAKIMNDSFVNIKVDREERPDVDKVYMTFVQATTGSGGWPLSVWLTPDLRPLVGGTYFPPDDQHFGRPGFKSILSHIANEWKEKKESLLSQGAMITEAIIKGSHVAKCDSLPGSFSVNKCFEMLNESYDHSWGGFGHAPKFPQPANFDFLLCYSKLHNDSHALEMVKTSLSLMAKGGINDHISQGFHRYSVDRKWHVPHFEKMLYDQGQLASTYADLFAITKDDFYAQVLNSILSYVARDLSNPAGGFYSGEDADSFPTPDATSKKEGAFCVWTYEELMRLLPQKLDRDELTTYCDVFCTHYSVEPEGNVDKHKDPHHELENQNVLTVFGSLEATASRFELQSKEVEEILEACRQILFDARQKRPKPHRDTKMIAAWNGLMISGFAKGGQVLKEQKWIDRATQAADFAKTHLFDEKAGQLLRSVYADDAENPVQLTRPIHGFADDYAFLICGLLDLYEACLDAKYLEWAFDLQQLMDGFFWDSEDGAYFQSASDQSILFRLKEDQDGAEPSANSISASNLLRLSNLLGKPDLAEKTKAIFMDFTSRLENVPIALPRMTKAFLRYTSPSTQIVIASSSKDDVEAKKMIETVYEKYIPDKTLIWLNGETDGFLRQHLEVSKTMVPLNNKATAYVCRNFACELPITSVDELSKRFL